MSDSIRHWADARYAIELQGTREPTIESIQREPRCMSCQTRGFVAENHPITMSLNRIVTRPPGFVDAVGTQLVRAEDAIQNARQALALRGYIPIQTPILEQSELFLRKSGGVLSSQMYAFDSPDGANVSLRPELTAPVIRHALEEPIAAHPRRFQYASPVLRYPENSGTGASDVLNGKRQFTQIGAELLGPDVPASDGEVIAAACETAAAIGVGDVKVVLGHAGLTWALLDQLRLPKRAGQFIALNLDRLRDDDSVRRMICEAEKLRIVPKSSRTSGSGWTETLSATQLASASSDGPASTGRRDVRAITTRLENKITEIEVGRDFEPPFRFMSRLASISGEPESALEELESLCEGYAITHDLNLDRKGEVQRIRQIIDGAIDEGVDPSRLTVDFGLPVGMAYYTGMIFELHSPCSGNDYMKLGGGGRYDGLASALGSDAGLPALGFALNLDEILANLEDDSGRNPEFVPTVLVGSSDADARDITRVARKLREASVRVVVAYGDINQAKLLAKSIDLDSVTVVDADGSTETVPL